VLESYSRERKLANQVTWEGWVDYERLGEVYRKADVFVFPSLEDIWGMVVMEAMIFGKPVLCSRHAGVAELISAGSNGFLFDPLDTQELARLMSLFLENRVMAGEMGTAAHKSLENCSPASAARFLEKVVWYCLQNHDRTPPADLPAPPEAMNRFPTSAPGEPLLE
jgi:glycosyltransferase involved in cell wall biosynthesis